LKDSGCLSALRLFGRLFHCSTVRTVKEFFLTYVLANCTASLSTPAAVLVLAPPFPQDQVNRFWFYIAMYLWTRAMSCLTLLSCRLSSPSSAQLSSYVRPFSPATIFTAFSCTFSSTSLSPASHGAHVGVENSRWGRTYCLYSLTQVNLSLFV
jgi:hypothetical protein